MNILLFSELHYIYNLLLFLLLETLTWYLLLEKGRLLIPYCSKDLCSYIIYREETSETVDTLYIQYHVIR